MARSTEALLEAVVHPDDVSGARRELPRWELESEDARQRDTEARRTLVTRVALAREET